MDATAPKTRTYTKTCELCGGTFESYRNIRTRLRCDRDECRRAARAAHNAAVATAEAARPPRRAPQPRTPRPLYGDFAQLAVLHGIDPATGRRFTR